MSVRRTRRCLFACALAVQVAVVARAAGGGLNSINGRDLKEWLSYIASDELAGRAVFTSGIGLAAAYLEDHLRAWGVRPAGDNGSYLQTVRVLGIKTTSHSTLTVEVGGETRTFADARGITFPKNVGGKRRVTIDRVEFVGYGLDAPAAGHEDYHDKEGRKDVKGAAVVWLGANGPRGVDSSYRRLLSGRSRYATEQLGAAASIGVSAPQGPQGQGRGTERGDAAADERDARDTAASAINRGGRGRIPPADFTTVQRLDAPIAPNVTASDALFEFLFSRAPAKYEELKRKAEAQDPLPSFHLDGVRLIFDLNADYAIVRTELAHNVVASLDGADPQLRNTYVAFGAHYDHVGYAEGEVGDGPDGKQRAGAPGRVTPGAESDRVWNGADDDGSGTVAVLALARAFAEGPRPKRSLLFVWHTGEERGLWGSRFFADYPGVPLDRIVAQLNIDMIGRNRDNKATESNTVYLVGSDRISSELDAIGRAANESLPKPLRLDYQFNDPADLEQLYFRSDHYSYAAKGIPIVFFTTGLHPDYHANTDEVSKIEFEKMTRVTQLVFRIGERLANLDHAPVRDNRGPRVGKATPTAR